MITKKRAFHFILTVLCALLLAPLAHAQLQTGTNQSNFGSSRLAPRFTPDPLEVPVTSGGDQDVRAMNLGRDCVGYATRKADYIVHLTGRSNRLRFFFEPDSGSGDAAIVVNTTNGQWRCNDDYGRTQNPMVEITNATAGQYDIWITSYQRDQRIHGKLKVTERDLSPGGAAAASAPPNVQLNVGGNESNYGRVSVASGFAPDPRSVTVTSGGSLSVRDMNLGPGCVGYATRNPDYVVNLTSRSSMLRFYVVAPGDTSLVINDAGNHWQCNDDSYGGQNPTVDIQNAPPGQYDIWVGSYESGRNVNGTLYLTGLPGQHP